jgi:hypothetical protein
MEPRAATATAAKTAEPVAMAATEAGAVKAGAVVTWRWSCAAWGLRVLTGSRPSCSPCFAPKAETVDPAERADAVAPTAVGQVARGGPDSRARRDLEHFADLQVPCGSPTAPNSE